MKYGLIKKAKGFINSGLEAMRCFLKDNRQRIAKGMGRFVIFIVKTIIEVVLGKWL